MTPKDWTLLVIAAAQDRPVQPVQLQKALFLLGKNLRPEQRRVRRFYLFTPYDYGPFSQEIYRDAEVLAAEGMISITFSGVPYRRYSVTPTGLTRANELREQLPDVAVRYLDVVVKWVGSLSFNDLVRAIYKAFPQMRVNSVFRG